MFNNMLMGAAGESIKATSFSVDNSLLINDGDNQYLRKINTGDSSSDPTNADIGTISVWFKRGDFPSGNNLRIWNHGDGTSPRVELLIMGSTNKLMVNGGATSFQLETNAVFRDPHAWYHAVVRIDTGQSTASDRVRLYINGTQITDLGTNTQPSQNQDVFTNLADWWVGRWSGSTGHNWDGYISELVYCDGQSLAPTAFGETDNNGVWRPIDINTSLSTNATLLLVDRTAGTAIGDMTDSTAGNNLAAAFDGVFGGADGANNATKRGSVSNAFVGKNWGSGVSKIITGFSTRDVNNAGYFDNTGEGRFFLYGSNSNPSAFNDGTLLYSGATFTSAGHTTTQPLDFLDTENFDTSTAFQYHWIALVPTSTASDVRMAELIFYEDDGNFGDQGFYLPFTDSNYIGADYSTGSPIGVARTAASEWNGDTGDFGTLDVDIIATGGNQGAIRTNKTFTGDFAFDFTWKGGSNPAYVGVYEIDEDGTFSSGSSDGGMGSMTDSFYLFFTSGNAVNALKGSSTEASSIFTAASGEVVKFQRSGSEFKVFEDGTLRHTFTGTSSSEVRILIGQSSSSLDWEYFRWVNGSTTLSGGSVGGTGGFFAVDSPTQTTDSPTTNAATFSPLITRHQTSFAAVTSDWTFTNGNRTLTHTSGSSGDIMAAASQLLQPGQKYHFEAVTESMHSSEHARFALALMPQSMWETDASPLTGTNDQFEISLIKSGGTGSNSAAFDDGSLTAPTNKPTTNSRLTFEVDMSTIGSTTVRYYFNGSLDTTYSSLAFADEPYYVVSFTGVETDRNGVFNFNFGSSAFTDTPTSGHTGLTAKDAFAGSAPTIEDGSAYFQTTLYTGNGASSHEINQSGENSTFAPDFLWTKGFTVTEHRITDILRGATKVFFTDSSLGNSASTTETNSVISLDSDGFTVGSGGGVNASGDAKLGWQWKAGDSNTVVSASGSGDGAINACTHRANQTAGFSLVKYEGANSQISNGEDTKVTHGLGAKPELAFIKNMDDTHDWMVLSTSTTGFASDSQTGDDAHLHLNTDDNVNGSLFTGHFETGSDSTHFEVGNDNGVNKNGDEYMAYVFRSIPGYSKVGSYTGGANSTNGIYVNIGFKPAWLMLKNYKNSGESWYIFDNQRPGYNDENNQLIPNSTAAEGAGNILDLLSNGFKIRANDRAYGGSSATDGYLYLAFAENPFAGTTPVTAR